MKGESAANDLKAKTEGNEDTNGGRISSDTRTNTPTDPEAGKTDVMKPYSASSSTNYLQNALGDVLADALSHVAKKRPADPIEYVANYLYSVSDRNSSKNQSSSSPNNDDPTKNRKIFNRRRRSSQDRGTTHSSKPRDEVKGNEGGAANREDVTKPPQPKRVEDHHYQSENSSGGGDTDEQLSFRERNSKATSWRRRRTAKTNQSEINGSMGLSTASTTSSFANSGSPSGLNRRFRSLSLSRRDDSVSERKSFKRRNNFSRYSNQSDESTASSNNTRGSRSKSQSRKSTTKFSKHLPTVAMTPDEYKLKRGMRLPPMEACRTPSSSRKRSRGISASDPSLNRVRAIRKPKQLDPLEPSSKSTFDIDRHRRRTQKLIEQRLR